VDNTQNIISFCTGYGGIELGIKRTGLPIRTVCYVEIEAFAVANLVAKIEQGKMDAAPIWTNLKTFDGQPFREKVHGIIGGYPCQPFSNAGQRKGTDDPRHLFPYICEHIRTIRPLWCFFENVGGHLNLGFDEVYKSLQDLGYKVEAGLFTAAEVGAPHKRERLFILAYAEGERPLREPGTVQQTDGRSRGTLLREPISTGGELGNSPLIGLEGQRPQGREQVELDGTSEILAYPNIGGSTEDRQQCKLRTDSIGESSCNTRNCETCQERQGRWPARPGQKQYDWEEPRTVESGMGRTVDGFACRVDRLRLCGNGVNPASAELAFRTLWNKTLNT